MLEKNPSSPSFRRYLDPTGEFSNRELETATWFIRHKLLIARICRGLLAAFGAMTIGYSVFMWGKYIVFDRAADARLAAIETVSFQNYAAQQAAYGAETLRVFGMNVFVGTPDTYDLVAFVKNPNARWLATIEYHFVYSGGETPKEATTVLPLAERPVAALGQSLAGYPVGARLVIDDVRWQRVNPHAVPDPSEYLRSRLMFSTANLTFDRAYGEENLPAHQIAFDIANESAYSFWSPAFYVEFRAGEQPAGLTYLPLDRFLAGETRHIELRSLAPDLIVTDIRLAPLVNVFDPSVFMEPAPK